MKTSITSYLKAGFGGQLLNSGSAMLPRCVIGDKLLNLFRPQFPDLCNGIVMRIKGVNNVKSLGQCLVLLCAK